MSEKTLQQSHCGEQRNPITLHTALRHSSTLQEFQEIADTCNVAEMQIVISAYQQTHSRLVDISFQIESETILLGVSRLTKKNSTGTHTSAQTALQVPPFPR